jgi:hypothetical protein
MAEREIAALRRRIICMGSMALTNIMDYLTTTIIHLFCTLTSISALVRLLVSEITLLHLICDTTVF